MAAINRTEEFMYFQNKAKHYDTLRNMKSSVKDKLQQKYLKTLTFLNNQKQEKSPQKRKNRLIPLIKQIEIKQENEKMINRLLRLYKSDRTQVNVQGNYSRFNKEERKFRSTNPYKAQLSRSIEIDNGSMKQRISKTKPRVGTSSQWSKHFGKTVELKKNMSRYLIDSNRSRGALHISVVDSFVPKYYESFLGEIQGDQNNQSTLKEIQITKQGLLILPDIKSKASNLNQSFVQNKNKKKLIFDSSRTSLNSSSEKNSSVLHQSQNPEKNLKNNIPRKDKTDRRKLLNFKFTETEVELKKKESQKTKKENNLDVKEQNPKDKPAESNQPLLKEEKSQQMKTSSIQNKKETPINP